MRSISGWMRSAENQSGRNFPRASPDAQTTTKQNTHSVYENCSPPYLGNRPRSGRGRMRHATWCRSFRRTVTLSSPILRQQTLTLSLATMRVFAKLTGNGGKPAKSVKGTAHEITLIRSICAGRRVVPRALRLFKHRRAEAQAASACLPRLQGGRRCRRAAYYVGIRPSWFGRGSPAVVYRDECPNCQGALETFFREGKWKHKCSVCKDTPYTCPILHP